ncbi:tyrosine-type recombinase/integrase [Limibacillus halophilus]|uniref:Integrase n=1 Tax=Limibacillus halophilus TaxID=1579333 RepID=A0A839SUA4_9PROT|nr:tyrosine-type recombinase/integrase [Limibacillus halophilus]MBB3065006.1 integrase [Limibacillus halophilus]
MEQALIAKGKPIALTLAVNSRGKAWTEAGLRASWRKLRIALEEKGAVEPGLTIHGLRHTVATFLKEAGWDEDTIKDLLGQKEIAMAQHYSRDADLRRKMEKLLEIWDGDEAKMRTVLSNPGKKVSNLALHKKLQGKKSQ